MGSGSPPPQRRGRLEESPNLTPSLTSQTLVLCLSPGSWGQGCSGHLVGAVITLNSIHCNGYEEEQHQDGVGGDVDGGDSGDRNGVVMAEPQMGPSM